MTSSDSAKSLGKVIRYCPLVFVTLHLLQETPGVGRGIFSHKNVMHNTFLVLLLCILKKRKGKGRLALEEALTEKFFVEITILVFDAICDK